MWNPLQPFMFLAGTSTGYVECFDCRKGEKRFTSLLHGTNVFFSGKLWSIEAHTKDVTGLDISGQCPGLLVTASADETVKTWDFSEENTPKYVFQTIDTILYECCLE